MRRHLLGVLPIAIVFLLALLHTDSRTDGAIMDMDHAAKDKDLAAMHMGHDHMATKGPGMTMDETGMTMNENTEVLPRDCKELSGDIKFVVTAGTEFAKDFPGAVFGLSQYEYEAAPCSRITVTFINNDEVRHQWMVHGLPRYLYPGGMFHIEAAGGHEQTGTFIVPSDAKTYLVHCDVAQHMEKGMKAQLKVNGGDGDLWSISGVSRSFIRHHYLPDNTDLLILLAMLCGFAVTLVLSRPDTE